MMQRNPNIRLTVMFALLLVGAGTSSATIRGPTAMMDAEKADGERVVANSFATSSPLGRRLFLAGSSPPARLSVLIAHQPSFENGVQAEKPEQRPFDYYDAVQEEDRRQQQALLEHQQLQQQLLLQQQQQQQFVIDGETAANDRLISVRQPVIVVEPAFPTAAGSHPFFAAILSQISASDMVKRPEVQQQQKQQPEEDVVFVIDSDSAAESESRRQKTGVASSFPVQTIRGSGWKYGEDKADTATPKVSIVEDSAREEVDDDSSQNSKEEPKTEEQEKSSKTIVGDSATEMPEVDRSTESALLETKRSETEAPAADASKFTVTEAKTVGVSDSEAPEVTAAEVKTEAPNTVTSTKPAETPEVGLSNTKAPEVDTSADKTPETVTGRIIDITSKESSVSSSASATTTEAAVQSGNIESAESSEDANRAAKASSTDLPIPPASPRFIQRVMN